MSKNQRNNLSGELHPSNITAGGFHLRLPLPALLSGRQASSPPNSENSIREINVRFLVRPYTRRVIVRYCEVDNDHIYIRSMTNSRFSLNCTCIIYSSCYSVIQ